MNSVRMSYEHIGPDGMASRSSAVEMSFCGESIADYVDCFKCFLSGVGYQKETIDEIFAVDE